MTRQVWVDFNSMDEHGVVQTLIDFAQEDQELEVGDTVTIGDDDGNQAKGTILEVGPNGVLTIRVNSNTFSAADHEASASA